MRRNVIFNAHILVDKLFKLNSSQQSIETLSHWCIFYRKEAKQIVQIWERQFRCSQRNRVSLLYLANDILQNSRWKGLEFVNAFWNILPNALNDLVQNGDEFEINAALRLVDIWEDRKVFGSHGQNLQKDLLDNVKRIGKSINYEVKPPAGGVMIQKLMSSYAQVNDGPANENAIFRKCRTAISFIEELEKESGAEFNLGNIRGPGVLEELKRQHGFLKDSIEQLKLAESSRETLLSHLRKAILEQEYKIRPIHNQLQVAQLRYDQVGKLLSGQTVSRLPDQQRNKRPPPPPSSSFAELPSPPPPPPSFPFVESPPPPPPTSPFIAAPPPPDCPPDSPSVDMILSTPPYNQQQPQGPSVISTYPHTTDEVHLQTSAGEVASTSSSHMFTYVMSADHCLPDGNKRPRLHNPGLGSVPGNMPQLQQPAPLPFPRPDFFHPAPPPPLPSISHIPPPLPASVTPLPQFGQAAGPMTNNPYTFVSPVPPYPVVRMPPYPGPPNAYHYQGSDSGGHFSYTTTGTRQ